MSILKIGPRDFAPAVVIFDKDGTLIDFDWMWGGWITELATRLESASGLPTRERLYNALGFDAAHGRVQHDGKLAATPMAQLYTFTIEVMESGGLSRSAAKAVVAQAWFIPDPVKLARPFTPLKELFTRLQTAGVKVAVATTDDREPTLATIRAAGAPDLVDTFICADDGIAVKPAPDMILTICQRLGLRPSQAVIVGDTVADMQMGRAAQAGLVVGVASGVSAAETLAPYADVVIDSIAELA
jgi:phosphoglycolate phosphatase-like HAD superfamily hydrolase